jgi:hypothetical protein
MRWTKTILSLAAVGIGIVLAGCAGSGTTSGSNAGGGATTSSSAGLNDRVKDGKFEFTVTSVKCGVPQVGPDAVGEKAQGQFCLVSVSVKNIGTKAQLLDDSSQYAYSPQGVKYSSNSVAGMELNGSGSSTFLTEINPGNQVTGKLVFDIPAGATISKLELHDSPFSGGVTVSVG